MSQPNWEEAIRPLAEPLSRPIRLAALISGGGTTVVNLHDLIVAGELDAELVNVIASRPDCAGIDRMRSREVPVEVIRRKGFESTADFSEATFEAIDRAEADLVLLAGFLAFIEIPERYAYRVLNIHPSLIPAFCGKGYHGEHVHRAAIERGVKVSGCTVHFADNEYDHGPIILQRTVPVLPQDTADSLAARVFAAECEAYPEAVRLFASGRLEIAGNRVRVRPV
ncbi:phosphoribosylglycinamide formyltransferase [Stratiformator vulcanicus]|uniref:Phosphoribosylglycinamide formyltransferase n=1 Tax=Stratiformator vulcanicus TaxID=2527980 RepID=A0A517QXW7_9PLAN|nr:phosphoribosylglycinamide formyltransferase [Stratiformator vulcanicus]QDT36495.1 Phosphoribosylglycinamide formyltransferase [Stratiformator vulcanicus]